MKANNLQSVLKNLPEEFKSVEFNEEVSAKEKGHYHILELNKVHLANEQRYVLTARVKKYNQSSWNGIKDELKKLGYNHMYILHDPTIVVETRKTATKKPVSNTED